jgi:hypothetical protein
MTSTPQSRVELGRNRNRMLCGFGKREHSKSWGADEIGSGSGVTGRGSDWCRSFGCIIIEAEVARIERDEEAGLESPANSVLLEQGYRNVKRITRPGFGFGRFRTARRTQAQVTRRARTAQNSILFLTVEQGSMLNRVLRPKTVGCRGRTSFMPTFPAGELCTRRRRTVARAAWRSVCGRTWRWAFLVAWPRQRVTRRKNRAPSALDSDA